MITGGSSHGQKHKEREKQRSRSHDWSGGKSRQICGDHSCPPLFIKPRFLKVEKDNQFKKKKVGKLNLNFID